MTVQSQLRVLLVYPAIPKNTYWSFSHALSFIGKKNSMPPLGLITVAAMLPSEWSLRLIDEDVKAVTKADLAWADMVFLSAMMIQRERFQEIATLAHEMGKVVVAGGPYPTQFYEEIRDVDHFVLNEAESGTLAAFLHDLQQGCAKRFYAHKVIRPGTEAGESDRRELARLEAYAGEDSDVRVAADFPSLADSPLPRFDLLDIQAYGSMAVQLSRGCPFNCEFCSEPSLFGHQPRLKTAERIIAELKTLYELGYRGSVFFVDDNFIGNIRKVMRVLTEIEAFQRERGYPFALYTEASLNLAKSADLMTAMRDAGFNMVFVGLETTDAATLEAANKHQNTGTELLEDVRVIQAAGMEVTAGFIVGMDREPPDICDQIFEFCQKAGIPTVMVGLLAPLRGSRLYDRLQEEGRLLGDPACGSNTHSFSLNYVPDRDRDSAEIINGYKNLLRRLYATDGEAFFERCGVMLASIGQSPTFSRRVKYAELRAFVLSLLRQSFACYGRSYRQLLLNTLRQRFPVFPEAVRLSIIGHHFIRITEDALDADEMRTYLQAKLASLQDLMQKAWVSGSCFNDALCAFVRDQQKGLTQLRKRIMRLPSEYRDGLLKFYAEWVNRLESAEQAAARA